MSVHMPFLRCRIITNLNVCKIGALVWDDKMSACMGKHAAEGCKATGIKQTPGCSRRGAPGTQPGVSQKVAEGTWPAGAEFTHS